MVQLAGQVVPLKLNAEKEGAEAARKYRVRGYPTVLFVDAEGAMVGKIVGYLPPDAFAKQFVQIVDSSKALPDLLQRVQNDPKDAEALARLAMIYAQREDEAKATEMLSAAEKADPRNQKGLLGAACNAVGDMFQNAGQFQKAISFFRKAATLSRKPEEVSYARLSIAVCYLSMRDTKKALPELEAVTKMRNAPAGDRETARRLLDRLREQTQKQNRE